MRVPQGGRAKRTGRDGEGRSSEVARAAGLRRASLGRVEERARVADALTAERWSRDGVTCIAPTLTAQAAKDPACVVAMAARTMTGRNGLPEDFRGETLPLASGACAAITGTTLHVDGGFTAA